MVYIEIKHLLNIKEDSTSITDIVRICIDIKIKILDLIHSLII